MDNTLTTEEAAAYLMCSAGTLENWRTQNTGPAYYKPKGRVYYLQSDLDAWIRSGRTGDARAT